MFLLLMSDVVTISNHFVCNHSQVSQRSMDGPGKILWSRHLKGPSLDLTTSCPCITLHISSWWTSLLTAIK